MLPRRGCGKGATVVLAALRATGALKPVLALAGCAQAGVPYAMRGDARTLLRADR
jgi:hypothetical protein